MRTGTPSPAPDGAGRPFVLHDLQDEFLRFAATIRHDGIVPPGQP